MIGAVFRAAVLSVILYSVPACQLVTISEAQQIFTWRDKGGRTHYSSSPDDIPSGSFAKPADLPQIKRENLSNRIDNLKSNTPVMCTGHGGVDCSRGADGDGSVICLDGFTDSVLTFQEHCSLARLQIQPIIFLGEDRDPIDEKQPEKISTVQVTLRNLVGIEAREMEVRLKTPSERGGFRMNGPLKVDPYGIADFTLILSDERDREFRNKHRFSVKVYCENCGAVVTADR